MLVFKSLPSTNRWVMERIGQLGDGDAVVAVSQTAGAGRMGRPWFAPEGRGLALTVVVRRIHERGGEGAEPMLMNIGRIAAIAISGCLGSCGIGSMFKWPNDVYVDGLKVAGVLAELDSVNHAIALGIGLNVNVTAEDIAGAGLGRIATSMRIAAGREFPVGEVTGKLLGSLEAWFDRVLREGTDCIRPAWDARDWLKGTTVELEGVDGSRAMGRYGGTDATGRLILVAEGREYRLFTAGDVVKTRSTGDP